jgi:hypothetical protein
MKTWKQVSPYSGQEIEEEAPTNSTGGQISMPPDALKKKKEKDESKLKIFDGRTKSYREHRKKLEAARARRMEMTTKKESAFVDSVKNFLGEGKYEIYHKDYSSAVQHAVMQAEKQGYEVDEDDYFKKIGTGPKKPSKGKTNIFSIKLLKNDKPQKKALQIQIYNTGKSYELNMYIQ